MRSNHETGCLAKKKRHVNNKTLVILLNLFFFQTHFKMPLVVFLSSCLIVLMIYGKGEFDKFTLRDYT